MLNFIEVKGNNMTTMSPIQLFNNLSNEDLLAVVEAGQLTNFCNALTLDMISTSDEKDTMYEA